MKFNLVDFLANPNFNRTDKLLACLSLSVDVPKKVWLIKEIAYRNGLTAARSWNVTGYLFRSDGKATKSSFGWILTHSGISYLHAIGFDGFRDDVLLQATEQSALLVRLKDLK